MDRYSPTVPNDNESVVWLENTGAPGLWPWHKIKTRRSDPTDMRFVDVDADGDIDIIPASTDPGDSHVWLENLGGANQWDERTNLEWTPLADVDVNGDGITDRIVWGPPPRSYRGRQEIVKAVERGIYWIAGEGL